MEVVILSIKDTNNIENLLNQYQRKYKNFYFVGAVPIIFDRDIFNKLCCK